MYKILSLSIILMGLAVQAAESPLELYQEKKTVIETPLIAKIIESKNGLLKIEILNNNKIITNPIFPIFPQFVSRPDYQIIKDECSYKSLKHDEKCLLLIKNYKNLEFKIQVYPYGKEQNKTILKLGKQIQIENKVVWENLLVEKLIEKPIVERIGVEASYSWLLDINEKKLQVVNDLDSLFFKIEPQGNKWLLTVYPQKEDFFNVTVKIVGEKLYQQSLKFTALVRKPISVKINPALETVPLSVKPIQLSLQAKFVNGFPLVWSVPVFLTNWESNQEQNFNGIVAPQKESVYKVKGSALGFSNEISFKTVNYWPFGEDNKLIVNSGETKILKDKMVYDFDYLEIKPNGRLVLEFNNPWVFIGAKDKIINDGIIVFKQKYSGDLSSNIPNTDGSLSGRRINYSTPINDKIENGGILYIKAKKIEGQGKIDLTSSGNEGGVFLEYTDANNFSGQIKGKIIYNQQWADSYIVKIDKEEPKNKKNPVNETFKNALSDSLRYILRYLILAGIPFLLIYGVFKKQSQKYKIQPQMPPLKQMIKEFGLSIFSAGVINLVVAVGITGVLQKIGLNKIYTGSIGEYGFWWYVVSFVVIIVLHDIYFYWTHRLLHVSWFYKKVHYVHHQSINTTPLTALSFHPVEAIMHFMFVPLVTAFIPFHLNTLLFFLWAMLIFNVNGHCGYEYWPKWLRSGLMKKIINNSFHHNQHHSSFNCNYSLYFNILDRFHKTNHPDYDQKVENWPQK